MRHRLLRGVIAAIAVMSAAPALAQEDRAAVVAQDLVLPVGTVVALVTDKAISSKTARKGDLVRLRVKDDVAANGQTVIPAGTVAVGEVTDAQQKGMMGRGGRLALRMLYLEMGDGRTVRVSGEIASIGDDQTALATAATTATLGFVIFITGKSATIPEGTQLQVRLDREARFPGPQ